MTSQTTSAGPVPEAANGHPIHSKPTESSTVLATSKPLGWSGVEVVHRVFRGPGVLDAPAGIAGHTFYYWRQLSGESWLRERVGDWKWEGRIELGGAVLTPARRALFCEWGCTPPGRSMAETVSLSVSPALLATVAAGTCDADPARLTPEPFQGEADAHLRYLAEAFLAEVTGGGPGGRLFADSLANLLAVHLIRSYVPSSPLAQTDGAGPSPVAVRKAKDYIHDNLGTDMALADIAAAAHLSPFHFCRLFKRATGLAPHQYVLRARVERAKNLLLGRPELPLAEVAARTGFSDQSHFTRHFKRLAGVTPGRYRQ